MMVEQTDLVRLRMVRMSNVPDTLYMVNNAVPQCCHMISHQQMACNLPSAPSVVANEIPGETLRDKQLLKETFFVICTSSHPERRFDLGCSSFSASTVSGKGNDPEAAGNPTYRTGPKSLSPQLWWRSHCRLWAAAASAEGVWSGRCSNWTTAG